MEMSKGVRAEGPCLYLFIFWAQNVSSQLCSYPGCVVVMRAVSRAEPKSTGARGAHHDDWLR